MAFEVKFDTGQVVRFENRPTQQDIEEVAQRLGVGRQQQQPAQPIQLERQPDLLDRLGNIGRGITSFTGGRALGEFLGGTIARTPFLGKAVTGIELTPQEREITRQQGPSTLDVLRSAGGAAATGALTAAGGAARGANLLTRIGQGAGIGAGFAGAKQVEEGDFSAGGLAAGAAFGGGLPIVGGTTRAIGRQLTQSVPKRLIQGVLNQSKAEKLAGKDVSEFVLKSRRIGSLDGLADQSESSIRKLSSQIDDILKSSTGKTVSPNDIFDDVVNRLNQAGGQTSREEIRQIITRLAPQAKGLFRKPTLNLQEATKLRRSLDKTIGDRGFLRETLPFNKEVLRIFDNTLRENIKQKAPQTRALFSELSKEITLRNALLDRLAAPTGGAGFSLFDVLFGGFGALGGGVPGIFAGIAAQRVARSPFTRTLGAQSLQQIGRGGNVLQRLTPVQRAVAPNIFSILAGRQGDSEQNK